MPKGFMMQEKLRIGFTLLEFLVGIAVIAVVTSLLLPVIAFSREANRKQACSNNIRQMNLALMEYEQSYKRLVGLNCVWGYGGYAGIPYWSTTPGYEGAGRWSGFIGLLPFMDETPLHTAFDKGTVGYLAASKKSWGPFGSVLNATQAAILGAPADVQRYPWSSEYGLNRNQVSAFRCPSDPGTMRSNVMWNVARTNYAFCLGDGQVGTNGGDPVVTQTRGAFQCNQNTSMASITDGASHVISFGEIATTASALINSENKGITEKDAKVQGRAIYELVQEPHFKGLDVKACRAFADKGHYAGIKRNWGNIGVRNFDALANYTGFNTINPPNSGSCTPTNNAWGEGEGIYTASSYHLDGAHAVFFDGSVHFISNSISTIDNRIGMIDDDYYSPGYQWENNQWNKTPNWNLETPFGVWGAMGSRAGNDAGCYRPSDSAIEGIRGLATITLQGR